MGGAGGCQEKACLGKEARGLEQSSCLHHFKSVLVYVPEAPKVPLSYGCPPELYFLLEISTQRTHQLTLSLSSAMGPSQQLFYLEFPIISLSLPPSLSFLHPFYQHKNTVINYRVYNYESV